jgi:hypothetical protein
MEERMGAALSVHSSDTESRFAYTVPLSIWGVLNNANRVNLCILQAYKSEK